MMQLMPACNGQQEPKTEQIAQNFYSGHHQDAHFVGLESTFQHLQKTCKTALITNLNSLFGHGLHVLRISLCIQILKWH